MNLRYGLELEAPKRIVPLDVSQKDNSKNNQPDASKVDIEIEFPHRLIQFHRECSTNTSLENLNRLRMKFSNYVKIRYGLVVVVNHYMHKSQGHRHNSY